MLQFATHEIGRFMRFKQFGQLFWESGGLFRISEDFFKS
jgi:hypothetical protein